MTVSTRIITNFKDILDIEDMWNNELVSFAENPQAHSRIFMGIMRHANQNGWTPLVITFWSNKRIVGMAPLKRKKSFYSNHIYSLAEDIYSDFLFSEEYRKQCIKLLAEIMFNQLKCRSANITIDTNSSNLELFRKECSKRKLSFREKPNFGRGIITIETSYNIFFKSLNKKVRRELQRIKRNFDRLGAWKISCAQINTKSINKILEIDQKSWKAIWRTKNNLQVDDVLHIILEASQPIKGVKSIYESEVWFLEVDGVPIAYQIVFLYKETACLIKTSFNAKYQKFSPGKFLINFVIQETFKKEIIKKIDFITNLPLVKTWKASSEHRTRIIVETNPVLSRFIRVIFRNPIMQKVVK